jgi:hypothetical protein
MENNTVILAVIVYDTNETIVAEADNPQLVGVNMRGRPMLPEPRSVTR